VLLRELRKKFSLDNLKAAAVVTKQNRQYGICPALATAGALAVSLPGLPDKQPIGIVTDHGSVPEQAAVLAALPHWNDFLGVSQNQLFVTFCLDDLAVLMAAGLPAVPAFGLTRLNEK